ncbi:CheR family methyltransferase [Variovorax sp. WS11]|uniref:CheR family methyltransferase n=1 Tax=Variovorax sp. WS11 TaxID=1105204 RepID=UPI0013DD4231|nr:CheR family methyltransferase [Variovorax sp. WS11]NDZ15812.1 chemotaxis protein CheR [Variovorax sp. WS11]
MYIESQASAPTVNSEFHFTDHDFAKIRTLIHRRAGIALGEQKRQMVYSRLSRRLRELRMPEFSRYLEMLESSHDGEEWQAFINSLTTNLTSFFREAHHFPVLAEHAKRSKQPVTIWCAAASTGEEPYSIAITLVEALGERASTARVIATDIDTAVLAKASTGVFTLEQVKGLPPERLRRFFNKGTGANAGKVRVRPEIAAMIKFERLNLLDPVWPVKEPVDAIFCRNVMIYFDKPTQKRILDRFEPLLKPGALLFAGHSENASLVSPNFKAIGQTVYEVNRKARS